MNSDEERIRLLRREVAKLSADDDGSTPLWGVTANEPLQRAKIFEYLINAIERGDADLVKQYDDLMERMRKNVADAEAVYAAGQAMEKEKALVVDELRRTRRRPSSVAAAPEPSAKRPRSDDAYTLYVG